MGSPLIRDADIRVVYDHEGNKREVLMSYEKYLEILEFI